MFVLLMFMLMSCVFPLAYASVCAYAYALVKKPALISDSSFNFTRSEMYLAVITQNTIDGKRLRAVCLSISKQL